MRCSPSYLSGWPEGWGYERSAETVDEVSGTGRVRKNARVNAAAEAQANFVHASARERPTMSLMPRTASIGQRSRAARNTPPDSISTAMMPRAIASQGNSRAGFFTSRSLDAIGPVTYTGRRGDEASP